MPTTPERILRVLARIHQRLSEKDDACRASVSTADLTPIDDPLERLRVRIHAELSRVFRNGALARRGDTLLDLVGYLVVVLAEDEAVAEAVS